MNVNVDNIATGNPATDLTLRSYADSDFTNWVDWARMFAKMLDASPLTDDEKRVVYHVLNMPAS